MAVLTTLNITEKNDNNSLSVTVKVNITQICNISEQVKSFINPEQIKAIAESNEPILLLSNN